MATCNARDAIEEKCLNLLSVSCGIIKAVRTERESVEHSRTGTGSSQRRRLPGWRRDAVLVQFDCTFYSHISVDLGLGGVDLAVLWRIWLYTILLSLSVKLILMLPSLSVVYEFVFKDCFPDIPSGVAVPCVFRKRIALLVVADEQCYKKQVCKRASVPLSIDLRTPL